jgi:hypothetical protein
VPLGAGRFVHAAAVRNVVVGGARLFSQVSTRTGKSLLRRVVERVSPLSVADDERVVDGLGLWLPEADDERVLGGIERRCRH